MKAFVASQGRYFLKGHDEMRPQQLPENF